MTVEVRLLGALAVSINSVQVPLKGARQRSFVGFLALSAGDVRSVDRIVEAVWGDEALPADPRQALHTYASRIRAVLGESTLTSTGAGYRLAIEPGDVDLTRFRQQVRLAREPGCSTERRRALLDEALDMWHGSALEDLADAEWARAEAADLEELRAAAEDDRAEASIELGRAVDAIGPLELAVARSPLRERTAMMLMTALHQSGRQAEALRTYQRYRRRLATDLGLEPGAGIASLEQSLAMMPAPTSTPALPIPARGYALHERIGEGAFSVVYRGTQPAIDRDVAVKVIRSELANQSEFIVRFETEAHVVARLEHPHVVPLYDYWREPGSAYLVMRLLRSGTLEDRISRSRLTMEEAARLVAQIGSALTAAHRVGVVHRDVKSANVFLDDLGNFFLGDFGIAMPSWTAADPTSGVPIGSPAYAAPEQLSGQPVGPQADIYGLAVTAFDAICGRLPFHDSPTRSALIHRQLHEPIPRIRDIRSDVPAAVEEVIKKATQKDPARRHRTIDEFISDFAAAVGARVRADLPSSAMTNGELLNPYKGLLAFEEGDAADFFGRSQLVQRIVAHLGCAGAGGRFVALVGGSGSGKSSVVRAGVLPALRAGALPGSGGWFFTSMTPGANPFAEFEAALSRVAVRSIPDLAEVMAADAHGIVRAVASAIPSDGRDLVIVVDQFEELFTLCPDEATRAAFVTGLVNAITAPESRFRMVLSLRADFYDRPLHYPAFAALFEQATIAVTPLLAEELSEAITAPAGRLGVTFEPGLESRILADVIGRPSTLPLLQYTLTELFDRKTSGMVRIGSYDEIGGLAGSLGRQGEALYTGASEPERVAVRQIFRRLATVEEAMPYTRRRVSVLELGDSPEVRSVLEQYGSARLLAFDRDPQTRQRTVEVAHEALFQEWPRLREWLDEDRDGLGLQRHLTASADAWRAANRDVGELYRGGRLESAERWASDRRAELNADEAEFLEASLSQRRLETQSERRARRRLRRAVVAASAVAVVAMIVGAVALTQKRHAASARRAAESATADAEHQRQTAIDSARSAETARVATLAPTLAETDPTLAMLLAAEANHRSNDPRTLGALEAVLNTADSHLGFIPVSAFQPSNFVSSATGVPVRSRGVAFDASGNIVTIFDTQFTVIDPADHHVLRTISMPVPRTDALGIGQNPVISGNLAAWVDVNRGVRVADLETGEQIDMKVSATSGIALDGAHRRLAIAGRDGAVSVVDLGVPGSAWQLPGDGINTLQQAATEGHYDPRMSLDPKLLDQPFNSGLAFSSDGQQLYEIRGFNFVAIDVAARAVSSRIHHEPGENPYGQIVAPLRDGSGRVAIIEPGGGEIVDVAHGTERSLANLTMSIQDLQSSFDAVTVTSGDEFAVLRLSGTIVIMTADDKVVEPALDPRLGRLYSVSATNDGSRLLVNGEKGIATLALDGSGLLRTTLPRPPDLDFFGATPDAKVVVGNDLANEGKTAPTIWTCSVASCREGPNAPAVQGEATFPSGPNVLLNYRFDQPALHLFDATTGASRSATIPIDNGGGGTYYSFERGWIAVTTPSKPDLEVRSLIDGSPITTLPLDGQYGLLGGPKADRLILFNVFFGSTRIIRTDTWEFEATPFGPADVVKGAFSPDGAFLVTVGQSGEVVVRDGNTFAPLRTLTGTGNTQNSAASLDITNDSKYLITAIDGRPRLWDLASGQPIGEPIDLPGTRTPTSTFGGTHVGFVSATDRWIEIWHLDPPTWKALACNAAGRNMTKSEWTQFGPHGEPYHLTCPQWPSG